ncbi:MAG TPA: FAD-binding oxidoreductase [Pseudonocardiaceae bacterium]|jgi:glycine/D-amino acid oxidase-like deaminating enzyme|nr:FAD-binding oxidoreductase [Pseudonocardiaceae bacterium]
MLTNGGVSFWHTQLGRPERRPSLPGSTEVDVCVVGAGYTGLWTAYYLRKAAPRLRIVVLEREFAGYGASGRNGGWLTSSVAGSSERYARDAGREAAIALQRVMIDAVDEVIAVAEGEGIEADIVKGGELAVATTPAQLVRLRAAAEHETAWGQTDLTLLSADELAARVRIDGALGGFHHPNSARVHPAKLVRGLAAAVERLGVPIHESTPVTAIDPHRVTTPYGTVRAEFVLRATEGFTARLPGLRREWLPMNSSMVVTEPLSAAVWDEIGWANREVLGDEAHAYMYAQRTADDRIAIGGRGVPYRYGSRTDADGHTHESTIAALRAILTRFWPATRDAAIEHAWSGVLAVPRDWCSTAGLDRSTGLGWAGGYVGHGVTTTNLAGRTLRDLVLGQDTELTRLPWVGRRVRRWEPEPVRWLAVRAVYAAYRAADRQELRSTTDRTSPLAWLADHLSGR